MVGGCGGGCGGGCCDGCSGGCGDGCGGCGGGSKVCLAMLLIVYHLGIRAGIFTT